MEVEYKTSKGTITVDVGKEAFLAYRAVQDSGQTNMWDWEAVAILAEEQADTYLSKDAIGAIMSNYRALAQEYDPERYARLVRA